MVPVSFIYCNSSEFRATIVNEIIHIAQLSIFNKGSFHLVLAGGNTPSEIYKLLITKQLWKYWHIYFGDERCLAVDDPDRNSKIAINAWLDHVPIPTEQIHIIPAEKGAINAASLYAKKLVNAPIFDLVLLGLGQDGHTASLFPGNHWGESIDAKDVLEVLNSPKQPASRVTLSVNRLSQASRMIFMVSGKNKRDALLRWKNGDKIPAAAIKALDQIDIYYDTKLD